MTGSVTDFTVHNIHILDAIDIRITSKLEGLEFMGIILTHVNFGFTRYHIHQIFPGSQPEEGHLHLQHMEGCGDHIHQCID